MKKFKTILNIAFVVTALLFISCGNDDDAVIVSNEITVQDLVVAIDENPTNGAVVGTVLATQTVGGADLVFSIASELPVGALSIDVNTGELTVADAALFDFETNPILTATVSVVGAVNSGMVTINLNDLNESATIGDYRDGGVVFWVDPTDDTKGLVCAVEDQSASIKWHNTQQPSVAGTSENIETGSANTDAIITSLGTSYAAGVARAYNGGGFSDWFLPSVDELIEMSNNRAAINTTATVNSGTDLIALAASVSNGYWSSSKQTTNGSVYLFNILTGSKNGGFATNNASVRAVRSF